MEFPTINKSWKKDTNSLAIVYPNLYYGGVYCLAPLIFYNIVNQKPNWICKRSFLDKEENLKNFNMVGFTVQYELDIKNIIKIIKKHEIENKILFAGGPCVNLNLKPLEEFIDFFVLGEVEELLEIILKTYEENKEKEKFLKRIADIEGIFVPKYSKKTTQAKIKDLNKVLYPLIQPLPLKLDKKFVFGKSFLLETERGCPFDCKFCPINSFYKITYRSLKNIKEIIDQGIKINKRDKVIIYSPSFSHPQRKDILQYLIKKNLKFSVPSLRVEFVDEELLTLIKKGGQKTLTIAPECGFTLRKSIGKFTSDEQIINFAKIASKLNFKTLKIYFMIGLPGQDKNDLDEIIELVNKLKLNFRNKIYPSINSFVPKPKTPFQNHKFDKKILKQQMGYLKKNLRIKAKFSNIQTSYLEWKISNKK